MATPTGAKKPTKKKTVVVESTGQAHIKASFNNLIISLTNSNGQIISWASAGKMGFRGSKKNTPYAAQLAAAECAKVAVDMGLKKVEVFVKGPGAGRDACIRTLASSGLDILSIKDITPIPHNGCRPPKSRRV
ncbi:MAG: 30S ribosomal protein S11 [Bacteroidia bacterium]